LEVKKALTKQQIRDMNHDEDDYTSSSRLSRTGGQSGGGGRNSYTPQRGSQPYNGPVWENTFSDAFMGEGFGSMGSNLFMGDSGIGPAVDICDVISGKRGRGGGGERPLKRRKIEQVDPEAEILRKLYVGNLPTDAKVSFLTCKQQYFLK